MGNSVEEIIYSAPHEVLKPGMPEWPDANIEAAEEAITAAATEIRMYYYGQLDLIRQIPYLMLEANGRTGFNDDFSMAYRRCLYRVQSSLNVRRPGLFMELRSGIFLGSTHQFGSPTYELPENQQVAHPETWTRISDRELYSILANQSPESRFEPSKVLAQLREKIAIPYFQPEEMRPSMLAQKAKDRQQLDTLMNELPLEKVVDELRAEGYQL